MSAGTPPLRVDESDFRPRGIFDRGRPTVDQVIGGASTVLAVHVGLPLLVLMIVGLATLAGVELGAPEEELPPVEQVIQARILQRGEVLPENQLPNRRVPILRTDTPEPAPSKRAPTEPPPPQPEQERQRDAVADALQRLSQDAQHFAEAEERRVLEGDPEGEESGDTEASEGDIYAGRLSVFFRRGWQVPTTIDRDSLQGLVTTVAVEIGDDLRVLGFRITRPSGNPDFDLGVEQQLQRLVDAQSVIPPPPEEVASNYLGRAINFRFLGRDAR